MPAIQNMMSDIQSRWPAPVERASTLSTDSKLFFARCFVTRVELQAVSSAMQGPINPHANEIRPDATDNVAEVAAYTPDVASAAPEQQL